LLFLPVLLDCGNGEKEASEQEWNEKQREGILSSHEMRVSFVGARKGAEKREKNL